MTDHIQSVFNNREIASGIWLVIFLVWLTIKADLKIALKEIGRALFFSPLILLFSGLAIRLALGVFFLKVIGWWTLGELKLTIFWFLISGTVLLGRSIQNNQSITLFRNNIRDQFKVIAVLEFVVVFYSFPLLHELWFVPVVTVLGLMLAMSETKSEYRTAQNLFSGIFAAVGIFLIYHFIQQTIADRGALFNWTTAREATLPILLSLWILPYCYLLSCYARWQEVRIGLNQKSYHDEGLRAHARRYMFWSLFLRPKLLQRAVRQFNMLPAKSEADLKAIVREVKEYEKRRGHPPVVTPSEGWSPYAAEAFLAMTDLQTGDFHDTGFDGEWVAESKTRFLDDAGLFETLVYRAKGLKDVVRSLQLKGCFNVAPIPNAAALQMSDAARSLVRNAIGLDQLPDELIVGFEKLRSVTCILQKHELRLDVSKVEEANILDIEFVVSLIE